MASIILSSIGSSVGNAILPGLGGKLLGAFARKIGHVVDGEIGWSARSEPKDGPRLENFKVQDSRYGLTIPTVFGRASVAGNVIWTSDLIETSHQETTSGGKGGVVSDAFSQTRTTYTYSLNCVIALAHGEIGGIQTIWADSKVIYQNGIWKSGLVASASVHNGADDQAVDPLLESWIGSGLTPAYRGVAYIVIEGLQLKSFGSRLPNMTFEIMPKEETGSPKWLGHNNPEIMHHSFTLRHGGMKPITVEGGTVSARRIVVGGYVTDGSQGAFNVIEYDVTGDTPQEIRRDQSAIFACQDVGDHSWAMGPDKRTVVMGLQDGSSGNPYHLALFDTQTNSFGPVLSVPMTAMQVRQIAWIDAFHFIIPDTSGTAAGVRVFARGGMSIIDRGFYDVWGVGTATTRVPIGYTQFIPYGDSLLMLMGDRALNLSALYACLLEWSDNALTVGTPYTVASGLSVGSGSGPQVSIQKTGEDEWTFFYMTMIDMQMMSFVPNKTGASITRPWQKMTSAVFTSSGSNAPVVIGNRVFVLHRGTTENIFRLSTIALNDGSFVLLSDADEVPNYLSPSLYVNAIMIDPLRLLVMGNVGFDGTLGLIGVLKRRNTGDTMDNVVARILRRAGYGEGDFDVAALSLTTVDGYTLTDQATAAGAIAPLQLLKPFDLAERDGKLVAVLHGMGEAIDVPQNEAGAMNKVGGEPAPVITSSRTQELDLPIEVTIDFHDPSRDYEVSSQCARRTATKGARTQAKVEMPLVCAPSVAKRVAEASLYAAWMERDTYRLVLSRKWIGIDPGDVIQFSDARIRVTSVGTKDGLVQVDGVRAVPSGFESSAQADSAASTGGSGVIDLPATTLALMDLPLLRNEDDNAGVYLAASGLTGWTGATIWRGEDGVNFTNMASMTNAASMGIAANVLPSCSCDTIDRTSTVRVQMLRGTLSSCSTADMLNGANAALLGSEIIQFQNATLIEPCLYELSNLLRGRRGTESGRAMHEVGERFVLLNSALTFLPSSLSDRNKLYHFRGVTSGTSIDFAIDQSFVYSLKTLEPFAPVHLRGRRSGGIGSDLTISWIRRARKNAEWVDYIDVPLDEDTESYDVEVMNGASVLRTFENVGSCEVVYTAMQQTADWGASLPPAYTVNVYQRSSRFGRGKGVSGIL